MLARILEPEVMDSELEAVDYDAMDHSTVNRVFVDDFLAAWDGTMPVLDVGTGTGQIPIELCRRSPAARVVAIDLAEHMLQVGRRNVAQADLQDRLTLQRVDAKAMPYPDGSFRALMSNSIIHHIPDPQRVFSEMKRMVAPGGVLFVRDLLRPADEGALRQLVDLYAAGANKHQRQMFADSLHAALTVAEAAALVEALGFAPATVKQTSDRHWTWVARA
jgi:ubiquinone/menaquinone biosynthesis C-methylase UbiE